MATSMTQTISNDSLETYSIFWLDASVNNEDNIAAQKKLRSIINQLRTFVDPEEFLDGVRFIQQGDLTILIVSGQMGRIVVPEMQKLAQVSSIYVYCFNKEAHLQWSQPYKKVKAVCTKLDELIDIIRVDQKNRGRNEEALAMDILDRSSTELNGDFLHSQLLIDVLIRMKPSQHDKNELLALLKKEYKSNDGELKLVNDFHMAYESTKAIWWYTRESFLYRMMNKALRVRNTELIFLFRTVIRDIYEQLLAHQCQKRVTAYRGQVLSIVEYKKLEKSCGSIISLNSFLSTSLNRRIAERFVEQNKHLCASGDHVVVIFEIEADPSVVCTMNGKDKKNRRPFAQIDELSYYGEESEVLFMLGSIFRLNEISHDQSSSLSVKATMSIIRMTLCSDHDNDLKQLYDHMKNKYGREETNLLSLGDVMFDMGKFDLAEKYYRRWLSELPSNDPSLGGLYYNLGMVADAKGEYDTSLEWYQKSLEILVKTRLYDHVNIGGTHNSIGNVHRNKGDRGQALESYNRAVSLFKQAHDKNHPHLASFYNNIGLIYQEEKKYFEALDFYEKSLALRRKHLPADHPDLGTSYNNIGVVHHYLGHYDLALDHYNRSLKIRLKSLPAQHPDIAMTYVNMGLVYEDKVELEQALIYMKKAQTIYEVVLPLNHPDVVKIKNIVKRVEDK
ncbi:unnamed protein product [Rotaria magnacalcarata]|uniref:Uncharacterized protein n=1 Tax=Rotaria magnacalcarata TaxID=392030 RepID=A0A816VD64_9BILA|nr:unnamed protein product [Rotaria magnacalcarata]CAF4410061.1 unnamed protein product [Rotaria magnacalcarata]